MPLTPFVSLSNFLIGQYPSLLVNPFSADPTTQLLYSIAKHAFQEEITENENQVKDVLKICEETEATMTNALSTLSEEIPDTTMWSRTRDILNNGKLVSQAYKRKYEAILNSDDLSSNTATSSINTTDNSTGANTNPSSIVSNASTKPNNNWEYVEQSLAKLNKDDPIPWENIYDNGRLLGLFSNYTKWSTMKSTYYRWKKKQT